MNHVQLRAAVGKIKEKFEEAIRTDRFNGKDYDDGVAAKQALLRSQSLTMNVHEVVKTSLANELKARQVNHVIHPPLGRTSPELKISGFLKATQQDVVAIMQGDQLSREKITERLLAGEFDKVGKRTSEHSIVIGVRSQLSSVAKNFDTLMERAFAETLNLRLRMPRLVMGEVYLLAVVDYDDVAMKDNRVAWKGSSVPVAKFINTFLGITERDDQDDLDATLYKYERSALVLADFRSDPPKIYETLDELKSDGHVARDFDADYSKLTPASFTRGLVDAYLARHQ